MTFTEFKAWFDGYASNIVDVPSSKQWERIKEKINEVNMAYMPFVPTSPIVTGPDRDEKNDDFWKWTNCHMIV